MKPVLAVLALIAAGLGVIGAAVLLGDRRIVVPPPEVVAESFARQISERRYDMATRYLSRALARSVNASVLRARFEPRRAELGDTNSVDATLEWMEPGRASARAVIDAQGGRGELTVRLVREHGLWVIDELPPAVPAGVRPRAN